MFLLTLLPSIVRDLLPARSWNQVEINPRERAVACTFVHRKNRLLQFDLYQLDWSQICSSSSSLTRHHSFFRKQPFTLLRMYDCFTWLCKSAVAKELFLNSGFVPLFGLKIQGLFKDFQGHIFHFSRTPESMLDNISYKFQGLSSTDCNFQGLEFLFWNSRTFKAHANPVNTIYIQFEAVDLQAGNYLWPAEVSFYCHLGMRKYSVSVFPPKWNWNFVQTVE